MEKTHRRYRDELGAAQARARDLELRLSAAETKLAELETRGSTTRREGKRRGEQKRGRVMGREIIYQRPATLFPLLRRWGVAFGKLRVREVPDPRWGSVIAAVFYGWVIRPVLHLARLGGFVFKYAFVLPWTFVFTALASALVLPIVLLAGFRFRDARPLGSQSWLSGSGGDKWTLASSMLLLGPLSLLFELAFETSEPRLAFVRLLRSAK